MGKSDKTALTEETTIPEKNLEVDSEAISEEELKALEASVDDLELLLAKRRIQLAWAVFALIIFIIVQFLLVVGICLPIFPEEDR